MAEEPTYDGTLREISTDAGVLRYHEAGDGRPLLLLHGSGPGVTGWRNFRGILATFAEHFRCLILEFPGFGVSDDFGGLPMATHKVRWSPLSISSDSIPLTSSAIRWVAASESTTRSVSRPRCDA
jgi:pimeloyl-ACP methyl ester carboxylesterase